MVSDFRTSFISDELKSRRADSPGPSLPERSKNPTPCLTAPPVDWKFRGRGQGRDRKQENEYAFHAIALSSARRRNRLRHHNNNSCTFRGAEVGQAVPPAFCDSLAHHFLMMTRFGALSVEFGVINLLPRAEVESALGHRNHHFMVHQQALQVRIAVGFAGAMMAVVLAERRQLFEPVRRYPRSARLPRR